MPFPLWDEEKDDRLRTGGEKGRSEDGREEVEKEASGIGAAVLRGRAGDEPDEAVEGGEDGKEWTSVAVDGCSDRDESGEGTNGDADESSGREGGTIIMDRRDRR